MWKCLYFDSAITDKRKCDLEILSHIGLGKDHFPKLSKVLRQENIVCAQTNQLFLIIDTHKYTGNILKVDICMCQKKYPWVLWSWYLD